MLARKRVAFFNPIFAHYRAALLRELRLSTTFDYFLFADSHDRYSNILTLDLKSDPQFTAAPRQRLLRNLVWQRGTMIPTLFGDFDAYILHGDANYISSWLGAIFARLRRRRVLFWTHGWTRTDTGLKRLVRRSFYRLGHGLLLYGDRAKCIGMDCGFAADALYVMRNSLDFDYQEMLLERIRPEDRIAIRARIFGDAETPVVIATARLTKKKRFDLLVRALGILGRRGRRANLLIVGDGSERSRLRALAQTEGVHAFFTGACHDEDRLAEYFACAAVTVSPGDVGLTCMHSLGYGVPVITHSDPRDQMPEWEAILPGSNGDLFEKDNVADLADKIERWIRTPTVPESVRAACLSKVAAQYNARFQAHSIELALRGLPAPMSCMEFEVCVGSRHERKT
jgi:glycosyltransferase involved in cell wall biosynthesis